MEIETTSQRQAAHSAPSAPDVVAPGVDADAAAPFPPTPHPAPHPRVRRISSRGHLRESGVTGLGERARLASGGFSTPLLDPLLSALPALRHALLNRALNDALRVAGAQLSASLAPSVIQFWIADPGVWGGETDRVGGLELFPTLRARVIVAAMRVDGARGRDGDPDASTSALPPGVSVSYEAIATDPLIEEVASARRAVTLNDADEHALAQAWLPRLSAVSGQETPGEPVIGTLLALPLRARGQFLGVIALAARQRLAPRQLTALQELADLVALAADRDRLLSYSRTQEALGQTMVRSAPVAMALLAGADHVIALANPAFFELLGVEESAMALGLPLADVIPESAQRLSQALRLDAIYQGSESQAMVELTITLASGVTYWNVITSPVIGEGEVIGGVLVAAVDVSRQVAARDRAQESADVAQERIGQMIALHATSLATASQLGADPRELLASILHRSISLLGAQAGVIYARAPRRDELEVVVSEGLRADYTGARVRLGQGLAGSVARSRQGRVVADYRADPKHTGVYDGESFTAIISVPLIHHNQVVGALDVLDDASRRAFTDDDLWLLELFAAQAAQAMENARMFVELEAALRKQRELDRMKDEFIAHASHELRTPLTGVKGFLELLQGYPAAQADPLVAEFVHQASSSALELEEIAERLIQTSRLDTGMLRLDSAPTPLAAVAEESLGAFRALDAAQGGKRQIEMDIPDDVMVVADRSRLKETLDNLISNALKYSPNGGRVRVLWAPVVFEPADGEPLTTHIAPSAPSERPAVVLHPLAATDDSAADGAPDPDGDPCAPSSALVEAARRRGYHAVLVCDEGIGIPEKERARLFGRFSRLESARASQIRGAGLGLYICRQTMRAMDGDVWLHSSEPGHGSVFAFALPDAASLSGASE
ncbi:MAG TPA: GAF domain-containing protein [Ktedonobacterales bacterium]|nr:GAF domain-containing protein [Ktedonobacterales bacterium]